MKKLYSFLIFTLFGFSLNAQNQIESSNENSSLTLENNDLSLLQNDVQDELPWANRQFRIMAGVFFPVNNTQVQVGTKNGSVGTEIDFENDLGFSKSTVSFTGSIEWKISRRSRLNFEYFYLNRTTTKTLQKNIDFGEHTYPANASVSAFFDNQILRVAYGYAIISKPKYEAGLLIGAHVLLGNVGLRLTANNVSAEFKDNFDFTAPLPDVGIWGQFALGKRFGLYTNINYLSLNINNISGSIVSYNLSVLYNITGNFSIVGGYTGLNFKVDAEKEKLNGYLKWGYNGPTITAAYSFGHHIKRH